MKANFKNIIMLLVLIVAVIMAVSFFSGTLEKEERFDYSDVKQLFSDNLVVSFEVDGNLNMKIKALKPKVDSNGNVITGEFEKDEKGAYVYNLYTYQLSYSFQLAEINEIASASAQDPESRLEYYEFSPAAETPWYQIYLPYIIVFVLFAALWFFIIRQAPGGGGKMNSFSICILEKRIFRWTTGLRCLRV